MHLQCFFHSSAVSLAERPRRGPPDAPGVLARGRFAQGPAAVAAGGAVGSMRPRRCVAGLGRGRAQRARPGAAGLDAVLHAQLPRPLLHEGLELLPQLGMVLLGSADQVPPQVRDDLDQAVGAAALPARGSLILQRRQVRQPGLIAGGVCLRRHDTGAWPLGPELDNGLSQNGYG